MFFFVRKSVYHIQYKDLIVEIKTGVWNMYDYDSSYGITAPS